MVLAGVDNNLHRHIGGLEKFKEPPLVLSKLHRHIGGLESYLFEK